MEAEEPDLVDRYLRGEAPALAAVDGWIRSAAGPYRDRLRDEWEDLLQELRLEVTGLLRRRQFRGESALKTYLWRAVNNTCIQRLRRRSRSREIPSEIPDLADRAPSPLAVLLRSETDRVLAAVLERTPPECRRIWGMILEGLDYGEMSRRLGVRPGALRVRALRCRRRAVALLRGLAPAAPVEG